MEDGDMRVRLEISGGDIAFQIVIKRVVSLSVYTRYEASMMTR